MLNQVRDDASLLKWRFFVGKALFPNTKNPFPEPVEGNLFAKGYRFFVGVKFFLPPQGTHPLRHPELVSGSVDAVAVCFTDPESSSG